MSRIFEYFESQVVVLALFIPIAGAGLLLVSGIAFFFITGWWALLASSFLLVWAVLACNVRRVKK